ncbi:MAG TPA: ATP-binding protein [Egibacteraceae bacterium]|nr:ATP-binding protein [Egibacteraceae bacterium]
MTAGLSTPLHLAASLLALSAAVGLAVVGIVGLRARRPGSLLVTVGALLLAVGHGLAGALVTQAADVAALLVPLPPLPPTLFAAAGGALAVIRLLPRGGAAALAGVGLGLLGAAELVSRSSATAGAVLLVLGALGVGVWLWAGSARRLLAKVATAFVALLLALIVLVAGILSGQASGQLVDEELARLEDLSVRLADEIGSAWPQDAIAAARPLRNSGQLLLGIAPDDRDRLADINDLSFRQQDFFALLGADGRVVTAYSDDPALLSGSFTLALTGAQAVDRILEGRDEDGGLVTVGGKLVALGAVKLAAQDARAEEPPIGVLLTGRVVDEVWAAQTARAQGAGIVVEVAEAPSVASPELPVAGTDPARDVIRATTQGEGTGVLTGDGRSAYAASAPIRDPNTATLVGRIATVRAAEVIAEVEREQVSSLFVIAVLGALAAGLVGAAITRRLVAPVRRLTEAAEAVRAGRLDTRAQVDTPDEIGRLGRTFDEMTTSLAAQSAELVEAAEVQSRLRARLEAMTDSMGDALVAVDAAGEIVTFNPAAERLTGRRAADVAGGPLDRALRLAATPDTPVAVVLGAPDSEDQVQVQVLLRGQRGRPVQAAVTASPVRDADGKVLGRVLVLRDMTREAEVERMKAEFLANVSHELRTPLTPIKGYADILARRDVDKDKARRYAQQILESTALLERIVGMIVDFAALDSGQVELAREPVRLSDLVAETLGEWRARHPKREFKRRVAKTLPAVLADPAMLRRALDELLDNAVKFSPRGEPVSVTAAVEEDRAGRWVRLSVRDRGVGIDPETAANVFSDFYQVDASETRQFGGLGLGLALVRRIVEGVGGRAAVDSEPDEGTEVHLLLPAAEDTGRKPRGTRSSG